MAQRRDQAPSGDEKRQAPESGEPFGPKRGYGLDNGEAEGEAAPQHGASPEPPREKGSEAFEEQQ
jgi:hypothetical protein